MRVGWFTIVVNKMQLSILIPARNEEYLLKTVHDILKHAEGNIEILVGADGYDPYLPYQNNLRMIRSSKAIGQRAMTNVLAHTAAGKYIMKVDAHCSFAQGFDIQMMEDMEEDMIMTATMCQLDVDDWRIIPKPFTTKYHFDTNMVFGYSPNDSQDALIESLCLQGSMFMVDRGNYWKWNLCDESYGSWGFQGVETACKGWFNGARVVTNTKAHYGHYFRNKLEGGEIPYERKQKDIDYAQRKAKELLRDPKMAELIKRFNYPADWTPEKVEELCL